MKICSKCGIEKEDSCYCKDKTKKDGLQTYCKMCKKALNKEYEKSDKRKEYKKAYDKTDKRKEYKKAYNKSDKHKEYKKAYNKTDKRKEYYKEYQRDYALKYPDKYKNKGERFFVTFVIKPIILERDNYCCQLCGINKELQLHHILPVKHDDTEQHISNPKNLVILCKECHLKAHDGHYTKLNMLLAEKLLELVKSKEKIKKTILPEYKDEKKSE